ncbi:protein Mmf1p, mitochondrial [Diutina rugosa]
MRTITKVQTANAPSPAASYSQAVKVNGFIYVSGQVHHTPSGDTLADASTAEKAEQCILNVKNVLEAANSDLAHVVKCTCFLIDSSPSSTRCMPNTSVPLSPQDCVLSLSNCLWAAQ